MEQKLREIIRHILLKEYMTRRDLQSVEDYADDLFSNVNVDVEFSNHFLDRVNDPRNGEDITPDELKMLYKKTHDKYGNYLSHLKDGSERVVNDTKSNINIPVGINKSPKPDKESEMNAITVMRKKDFLTKPDSPKLKVEDINIPINVGDEILGGKFLNKKIIVKNIGTNEKGDITINKKPLLRFRIPTKKD